MSFEYFYGMAEWRRGNLDWLNDDVRIVLVTSGYVASQSHQFLSSVGAGARLGTSGALAAKSVSSTTGACGANPITVTGITAGTIAGYVLYKHTGVEATSTLLGYYNDVAFFPMVSESDMLLAWDADGVLK